MFGNATRVGAGAAARISPRIRIIEAGSVEELRRRAQALLAQEPQVQVIDATGGQITSNTTSSQPLNQDQL